MITQTFKCNFSVSCLITIHSFIWITKESIHCSLPSQLPKTCKKWDMTLSSSMAMHSVMRDIHDAQRVSMERGWVDHYLWAICKYLNKFTLEWAFEYGLPFLIRTVDRLIARVIQGFVFFFNWILVVVRVRLSSLSSVELRFPNDFQGDFCPVCPLVLKRGGAWPFQRSKNDPFLTGNQGHFTHFYPYFAVNEGKSSVKIPPYYPFKDIFSILYPISREVKDKILKKKKIPFN